MGILTAHGTIDLSQFWPEGESDADTTKLLVERFQYQDHAGARPRTTKIFEGAQSRGRGSKTVIDKQGRITIRSQGIDAPELHYQALAEIPRGDPAADAKRAAFHKVNRRYRQHGGETATVKLAAHLRRLAGGSDSLPCQVRTEVDHPSEVFDTYGRMIGNLLVGKSFDHDLNLWLAEEGWAFPTFYSSMRASEIEAFRGAAAKAKKAKKGIWKTASQDTSLFDWNLVYEKNSEGAEEPGPILMPKIFRRVVAFQTNRRAKLIAGTFAAYLRKRRPPEACFETDDFLENGLTAASPRFLPEFLEGSRFAVDPGDLIFQEAPSTLFDAAGGRISRW
jgi:endonuclease YncB( thermonuclease family)